MPRRVLRIVTRLNRGGPLRQLTALVPALRAEGWSGPVIAGVLPRGEPDGAADLRRVGVDVIRLPSLARGIEPGADARSLRALLGAIRYARPDLVHTHMGKAGALGRLAAALTGVPVVHTYHGHHLRAAWPRDLLSRRAERLLGRLTDLGIALGPRQRRDLAEHYRVLPPERIAVVAPGLDVGAFRARARLVDPALLRRRAGADGAALFVWVGRFVTVKDPLGLVEAVRRARRPFRVVLLGDGPLRHLVRREVSALGLAGRVLLPGPVEDPSGWILASDGVVLSSLSEGAPLAVLEAKVLSRLAVVTAVGGAPDLVRHGVDGLWVPPRDPAALARALDRLAGDPGLARRLGRAASENVEARYGARRLGRETAAAYRRALESHAAKGGKGAARRYHRFRAWTRLTTPHAPSTP